MTQTRRSEAAARRAGRLLVLRGTQLRLEPADQAVHDLAAARAEEVDRGDPGETAPQLLELAAARRRLVGRCRRRIERAHLLGERMVVDVARLAEQRLDLASDRPSTKRASQTIASPPPSAISRSNQTKSSSASALAGRTWTAFLTATAPSACSRRQTLTRR